MVSAGIPTFTRRTRPNWENARIASSPRHHIDGGSDRENRADPVGRAACDGRATPYEDRPGPRAEAGLSVCRREPTPRLRVLDWRPRRTPAEPTINPVRELLRGGRRHRRLDFISGEILKASAGFARLRSTECTDAQRADENKRTGCGGDVVETSVTSRPGQRRPRRRISRHYCGPQPIASTGVGREGGVAADEARPARNHRATHPLGRRPFSLFLLRFANASGGSARRNPNTGIATSSVQPADRFRSRRSTAERAAPAALCAGTSA